jgi:hypothetical protein
MTCLITAKLPKFLFGSFCLALLATSIGCSDAAEQTAPADNTQRIVVMGDFHSDIGVMRRAFQLAGAIDTNDQWIGNDLTIVQLGDLIGRSDDEREVLDFMFAIQAKAEAGGGTVHALIGNHEVMGARVDNQAVGPNPFPAYDDMQGLDLNDPRLRFLPPWQHARGAALMAGGPYARRLAEFPVILMLGETIFVHGGVVPRWASYGIERINEDVKQWLLGNTPEPDSSLRVDDSDRAMWTRQFSSNVSARDCALLDESLQILGAKRMIVAHTVHAEITPRCDGKVWAIDVGMSRAYGGEIQLLELINDEEINILAPSSSPL